MNLNEQGRYELAVWIVVFMVFIEVLKTIWHLITLAFNKLFGADDPKSRRVSQLDEEQRRRMRMYFKKCKKRKEQIRHFLENYHKDRHLFDDETVYFDPGYSKNNRPMIPSYSYSPSPSPIPPTAKKGSKQTYALDPQQQLLINRQSSTMESNDTDYDMARPPGASGRPWEHRYGRNRASSIFSSRTAARHRFRHLDIASALSSGDSSLESSWSSSVYISSPWQQRKQPSTEPETPSDASNGSPIPSLVSSGKSRKFSFRSQSSELSDGSPSTAGPGSTVAGRRFTFS